MPDRRAFLLAAMLAWYGPATARAGDLLTLTQAQAEARAHAPDVDLLTARATAAEELERDAGRAVRRDPWLNFNAAPGQLGGDRSEQDLGVGLRWSVDVTGSWVPRRASARADRQRVGHEREDGLRALDEAVALAHADVAFLQRQLDRAVQLAALHAFASEAAQRQLSAGTGNQLDLDAAELDRIQADATIEQLQGDLRHGQVRLARLLGRPPRPGLRVEDVDVLPSLPPSLRVDEVVERDPRVQAGRAERRAAEKERDSYRRLIWGGPTFGVDYNYRRRSIAAGAFRGPGAAGLTASWTDQEVTVSLAAPIPVADRQTAGRARNRGRLAVAEAQVQVMRADVAAAVAASEADLLTAAEVLRKLAASREILERELQLVEVAIKAGTLDAVTRATTLRRLLDVGRRLDEAQRAYRVAHAHWLRQTSSTEKPS